MRRNMGVHFDGDEHVCHKLFPPSPDVPRFGTITITDSGDAHAHATLFIGKPELIGKLIAELQALQMDWRTDDDMQAEALQAQAMADAAEESAAVIVDPKCNALHPGDPSMCDTSEACLCKPSAEQAEVVAVRQSEPGSVREQCEHDAQQDKRAVAKHDAAKCDQCGAALDANGCTANPDHFQIPF